MSLFTKLIWIRNYSLRKLYYRRLIKQSEITAREAKSHPEIIHIDKPYHDQKILLIALYEKSHLRPDIKRLLLTARGLGYFIVGCNTQRLSQPETFTDFFDLYLERFNFGRDFGSYQSAFLEIFKRGYHLTCPRLIILNDSVFYESTRTLPFLHDMMDSEVEVLGATENVHLRHHLGSFCIAMGSKILKDPKFIKFWNKYIKTDIRPIVIERGEKDFTDCLKSIVSNPDCFRVLYDVNRLSDLISSDEQALTLSYQLTCRSGLDTRLCAKETWNAFLNQYYFLDAIPDNEPMELYDVNQFIKYLKSKVGITDQTLESKIKTFIRSKILHSYSYHSQIHTNAVLLLKQGLPLIKLDGFYRGFFSAENVLELCAMMNPDEAKELQAILYSRPFGKDVLVLHERLLFESGYI